MFLISPTKGNITCILTSTWAISSLEKSTTTTLLHLDEKGSQINRYHNKDLRFRHFFVVQAWHLLVSS